MTIKYINTSDNEPMVLYPKYLDTDENLLKGVNNFKTLLYADIVDETDSIIRIKDASRLPDNGYITLIDNESGTYIYELIYYQKKFNMGSYWELGSSKYPVTRGANGTTASYHRKGTIVAYFIIEKQYNLLSTAIQNIEKYIGSNSAWSDGDLTLNELINPNDYIQQFQDKLDNNNLLINDIYSEITTNSNKKYSIINDITLPSSKEYIDTQFSVRWKDNATLYITTKDGGIYYKLFTVGKDGSNLTQVNTTGVPTNEHITEIAVSPTGKLALITSSDITSNNPTGVYTNKSGSFVKLSTINENLYDGLSWSPDETQLVFKKNDGKSLRIWNVDTDNLVKDITDNGGGQIWTPQWYKDGNIYYMRNFDIYSATPTNSPGTELNGFFADGGNDDLFISYVDGSYITSSSTQVNTATKYTGSNPELSPDKTTVASINANVFTEGHVQLSNFSGTTVNYLTINNIGDNFNTYPYIVSGSDIPNNIYTFTYNISNNNWDLTDIYGNTDTVPFSVEYNCFNKGLKLNIKNQPYLDGTSFTITIKQYDLTNTRIDINEAGINNVSNKLNDIPEYWIKNVSYDSISYIGNINVSDINLSNTFITENVSTYIRQTPNDWQNLVSITPNDSSFNGYTIEWSDADIGFEAWKAFNISEDSWKDDGLLLMDNRDITITLPESKRIQSIMLESNLAVDFPTYFKVEGSNDKNIWDDIYDVMGMTTQSNTINNIIFENNISYLYYRLTFSGVVSTNLEIRNITLNESAKEAQIYNNNVKVMSLDGNENKVNITGDLNVSGKLTVDGLIDPTGLELVPQVADPIRSSKFGIWVNKNVSNMPLMYSNGITSVELTNISSEFNNYYDKTEIDTLLYTPVMYSFTVTGAQEANGIVILPDTSKDNNATLSVTGGPSLINGIDFGVSGNSLEWTTSNGLCSQGLMGLVQQNDECTLQYFK